MLEKIKNEIQLFLLPLMVLIVLAALTTKALAGNSLVEGVRIWSAPDHSRLVFDVDGPIKYKLFTLPKPDRVVIDFQNARLRGKLASPESHDLYIKKLRFAKRNQSDFRVVLDLKGNAKPNSFILKPNKQYGYRLVVDLEGKGNQLTRKTSTAQPKAQPQTRQVSKSENKLAQKNRSVLTPAKSNSNTTVVAKKSQPKKVTKTVKGQNHFRDVVIAIDAGHGGDDPGASGPSGTREKVVVYQIAKRLYNLLKKEKGFKPVLTRQGDYYIGLRNRMKIARKHKADLFISIHADAFKDPRVRGASVYVLSSRGASNEAARWLADRENAADLVGGVKLEDKDDMLASVLLDLSQTATRQASTVVADSVYSQLKKNGKTHGRRVLKAGFVVLKSPDVPSLLVETAFISNPDEERKLKSPAHQQKMAKAIMTGVKNYFVQSPPQGTWLAANSPKRHVIVSGETLSEIAQQYRVSLNSLRRTNGIKGDRLRVGQILTIPRG